jgi:hypothetical protein
MNMQLSTEVTLGGLGLLCCSLSIMYHVIWMCDFFGQGQQRIYSLQHQPASGSTF